MATRVARLLAGLRRAWRSNRAARAVPGPVSGDAKNRRSREWPPPAGHVIDNPISGERIVIRESGAQTGGELLSFDLFLPPGGHVPARHAHPEQEERFTVVAGRIRFRLGRRTILARPGDTVLVPVGTAHWFGNDGAEVAHALVEVRPALRLDEAFEASAAMGRARHYPGTRLPLLTDLARYLLEFRRELAVPDLPAPLLGPLLIPLARLGRRRGDGGRQVGAGRGRGRRA